MGDKSTFFTQKSAQEEVQPQVSTEIETLQSRVRCVGASLSIGCDV